MNTLNPSRKLVVLARTGCYLFLLAGWLATSVHAGVIFTSLYSFTGTNDGANPVARLIQGSDGYLYGTTQRGGTNGFDDGAGGPFISYGTVFKISTNGTLTSLYSFGSVQDQYGDPLDGEQPEAGLVQGSDGNFYGTTSGGGYDDGSALGEGKGYGTVFKITTNGVLTSLYLFTDNANLSNIADGANPDAALVQANDGNFYGTTLEGGIGYNSYGPDNTAYGTVFKISTNGVLTSLYTFNNTNAYPRAGLIQGNNGNFYGTTSGQGPAGSGRPPNNGTVFKISTNGVLTNLHSFTGQDGSRPYTGLVQGSDGSLYGTAAIGGTNNSGTVFKINPMARVLRPCILSRHAVLIITPTAMELFHKPV